jgi:hypothetical protein
MLQVAVTDFRDHQLHQHLARERRVKFRFLD